MAEEKKKQRRTVGNCIKGEILMWVKFSSFELKQFVEKGILIPTDETRECLDKLCAKSGVKVHAVGKGSAVKELKEKYNLSPAQLARKIMDDPALLKMVSKWAFTFGKTSEKVILLDPTQGKERIINYHSLLSYIIF